MADVRGVRASSRRKTPTPQPEKVPAHARRMRSQSRELEAFPEPQKPTRRKLTIIEEDDVDIPLEAPATPQRVDIPLPLEQQTFRSPGAVSAMSGTTAISSFSMVEAEYLEPKYIQKHLRKLCDSTFEFLDHLAPASGSMQDDLRNIQEMQKPGSEFAEEYGDFDDEFRLHLKHFKGDESNYINPRAIHRSLFESYTDSGAMDSGINLVIYLANTLILVKQMIHSSRSDKDVWNHLRLLDTSFPSPFMRSLLSGGSPTAAGDSVMLEETFKLALELRIQLTILTLERSAGDPGFNPDDVLDGVFVQEGEVRGWDVAALGGEDKRLPQGFTERIASHYNQIRALFPVDTQSLEDGHVVDLDGLSDKYKWIATILLLLDWARARRDELGASIDAIGGPATILSNVKQAIATPRPVAEDTTATAMSRDSPRKTRSSFGRNRRRSSRRFDPNAPVDLGAIDALKARERDSGVHFDPKDPQPGDVFVEVAQEEDVIVEGDDIQETTEARAAREDAEAERELSGEINRIEGNTWNQTFRDDDPQAGEATLVAGEEDYTDVDKISGPPTSTQDILAAMKSVQPTGKENRKASRFVDRQATAKRVDFGNGFDDSQPTPGPSTRTLDKGKQRADPPPSVSKKRQRDLSEDEEDSVFEAGARTDRVQERRQKASVSKRARIERSPPSSAPVPPSHQPERASQRAPSEELRNPRSRHHAPASSAPQIEQEEGVSEPDAPEMTEPAPPRSTAPPRSRAPDPARERAPPPSQYNIQHSLAQANSRIGGAGSARQPRREWTDDQVDAFVEYMGVVGPTWAQIAQYDQGDEGYAILGEFTQVNLKDKARTMAVNMIK
ncbi:hypothetical protein E8E11_001125 [Didymella keratinophila]|nr:hypothetical protein E8E11_001125 [Didymella keratinophila]